MTEQIHLLIGYEQYYPHPDNTLRVFTDKDKAERICKELKTIHGKSDHQQRYEGLKGKYDWLPEYPDGCYDVVTHKVNDEEKND